MTRRLPALLLLCTAAGGLSAQAGGVATITPEDVARRVFTLAHDSMGGRFTPSPELDRAAAYVAAEFARFGLIPAGDSGSFVQHYRLSRIVPDTAAAVVQLGDTPAIRHGGNVVHWGGRYTAGTVTGPAVLVTGLVPPDGPAVVEGAVVILAVPTDGTGQPHPRARAVLRAVAAGRPAAIIVPTDAPDEVWREVVRDRFRTTLAPAWGVPDDAPRLQVRDRAIAGALAGAGVDLGTARQAAGSVSVRRLGIAASVRSPGAEVEHVLAPNVAALLRGGDPALRDEVVVLSAHMDHVGVAGRGRCRPVGADSICNGADDNASGTASVLELAEAFAATTPLPRRSILFVAVSGEERGLWGSDYFTANPPVPIGQMVANFNLDMVGRNWTDTIVAIGREHSDLGTTLARVEAAHPELGMRAVDDLWPDERFYYRSDHYHFARRGIPILFFFNGPHADYHRPSDHPELIDAEKQARLTRLLYYLTLEVANAPARPAWVPKSYEEIVTEREP
jgi:hypothetical protein